MMSTKELSFSKEQQATLQHLADLLHLFHHRNNNQHRRSIWYRHFSTFRRQLNTLLLDISTLNTIPTTHLERTRKKSQDIATWTRISDRLAFWQDVLVPKWHLAFSQLVADARFAVLGVVLIAVLAQVCGVTGVTREFEELGEREVVEVIEKFGRELWTVEDVGEDAGEVVQRDGSGSLIGEEKTSVQVAESPKMKMAERKKQANTRAASSTELKVSKKKRKKGGDAIDDLFSGLG